MNAGRPNCFRKVVCVNQNLPLRGVLEKETLMKIISASALAIGLMMASAQAMPIAPVDKPISDGIIRVAQGCGPGMHRGPGGMCRPLYTCPPGWHTGPYGKKCFRD